MSFAAIAVGVAAAATAATAGYELSQGGGPDYAGQAASQERARQAKITQGTQSINQAFAGFDPAFYQQRAQAYSDFALPQLADQYRQTRNQLGFNLANRGLQGGSAEQTQYGNLETQRALQTQSIYDTGQSQAQDLQNRVQNQQNTLLAQLNQSADPASAQQGAVQAAASFGQPSAFQPLGSVFSNLINQYYANQLINAYRPTSYVNAPPQYTSSGAALPAVTYGGQ